MASTLVLDRSAESTMVQSLLDIKEKLDHMVDFCFEKDVKFTESLREAFESSVNKRQNKPAELIGEFMFTCLFFLSTESCVLN